MCIAIVKPAEHALDEATLRRCFERNPDGAGYAWRTANGMILIRKGFLTFDSFLQCYTEDKINEYQALIHFRITTRGDGSADNCHPFKTKDAVLVHNGTLHGLGVFGVGKSDTALLADMLSHITFEQAKALKPILDEYTDGSRVALMHPSGELLVLNENDWKRDENGVLYSNDGYKEHSYYYGTGFLAAAPNKSQTPLYEYDLYERYDMYEQHEQHDAQEFDEEAFMFGFFWTEAAHTEGDLAFYWEDGEAYITPLGTYDDWSVSTELTSAVVDAWYFEVRNAPPRDDSKEDEATVIELTRRAIRTLSITASPSSAVTAEKPFTLAA